MLTRQDLLRRAAGGAFVLSVAGCAGGQGAETVRRAQRRRVFLDRTLVLRDGARVTNTDFVASVALEGPAIRVVGRGVELVNVAVDFAEKPGAAIEVLGTASFMDGLEGAAATGIHLGRDSAELDCVRVTASDFGREGEGIGFDSGSGLLRLSSCSAERCSYAGFFLRGEREGCSLQGASTRNMIGAFLSGANGVVAQFNSEDDDRFGVYIDKAEGWRLRDLEVHRTGATAGEASATDVELWSDSHPTASTAS